MIRKENNHGTTPKKPQGQEYENQGPEETEEMIQPAKDRKRERKRRAKAKTNAVFAQADQDLREQAVWAEAFMVLLLAKAGGSISISKEKLAAYNKIRYGMPTKLTCDEETGMVTLSLVDVKLPDNLIVVPEKKLII